MNATMLALVLTVWESGGLAHAQDTDAPDVPAGPEARAEPDAPPAPDAGDLAEGEARSLFEAGSLAFANGQFQRALEHFTNAYELSGRPRLLYNIGLVEDRLRHDAEALAAFERYLAAEPESPHRAAVDARIVALRAAIAEQEAERAAREDERRRAERERLALEARAAEAESGSVLSRWWFWTIVGVVVAGAAVATVLVATHDPGTQDPIGGTQGIVIATLH